MDCRESEKDMHSQLLRSEPRMFFDNLTQGLLALVPDSLKSYPTGAGFWEQQYPKHIKIIIKSHGENNDPCCLVKYRSRVHFKLQKCEVDNISTHANKYCRYSSHDLSNGVEMSQKQLVHRYRKGVQEFSGHASPSCWLEHSQNSDRIKLLVLRVL